MAKVRGITVEIAADAKKFKTELNSLNREAKNTQRELNDMQKSLYIKYDPTTFVEAQKVAQKAIDVTRERSEALRLRMRELEKAGSVDTAEYKKLQSDLNKVDAEAVKLEAQLKKLNEIPLKNLQQQIDKVANGFTKAGNAMKPISAMAGGAVASLGALGAKAVKTGADLQQTATQLGMTAEQLQRFNYIALQTSTDSTQLQQGFIRLRKAIGELASGVTNKATESFERLRINFADFESPEELFYGVADALGTMDNRLEAVAIANDIFGQKVANSLIPIIEAGGDAIKEYSAEFAELGSLSNEQVAKLDSFNSVLGKIKTQLANVATQIGTALMPILEKIADFVETEITPKLQKMQEWFAKLSTEQLEFGLKALAAVAMIAPLLLSIGKITKAVSGIIGILPKLKQGLSMISKHPIIAIIGVIVGLMAVLYATNEEFKASIDRLVQTLGSALMPILRVIGDLFMTLFDALMPIVNIIGDILVVAIERLADMLLWAMPFFDRFAEVATGAVEIIRKGFDVALKAVEKVINGMIDALNKPIDWINKASAKIGVKWDIPKLDKISLSMGTSATLSTQKSDTTKTAKPSSPTSSGGWYDSISPTFGGDTNYYDYDNSTKNVTQNVTVVVENYAEKIDVDDMVRQINLKLAEVM